MNLSLHVKPPIMAQISFDGNGSIVTNPHDSGNIASLIAVDLNLNIHDDPVIIRLRTTNTEVSKRELERALMRKKIFIQNQMRSFIRTSGEINSGLENWAADTEVSQVYLKFHPVHRPERHKILGMGRRRMAISIQRFTFYGIILSHYTRPRKEVSLRQGSLPH